MISFNIHEVVIHPTSTNFFASQGFENVVAFITALITLGAVFVAIKTYMSDVEQKKIKNTLEFTHNFLDGNWISKEDKKNWNFMYEHLERKSLGDFDFTNRFGLIPNPAENIVPEYQDVMIIFSEGEYLDYGKSVIAVMKLLEFLAKEANEEKLNFNLVSLKLFQFYKLAIYYIEILNKNKENKIFQDKYFEKEDYSEISKLYKKLSKLFSDSKPFLDYCTFQLI